MSGALELSMQVLEKFLRNVGVPGLGKQLNPPLAHADTTNLTLPGIGAVRVAYLVFVDDMRLGRQAGAGASNVVEARFGFSRTSLELLDLPGGGDPLLIPGLAGTATVSVPLVFAPVPSAQPGRQFAQLAADLSGADLGIDLDPAAESRISAASGGRLDGGGAETALRTILLSLLRSAAVAPVGEPVEVMGDRPSTGLLSVSVPPTVELLDNPPRLRVQLQYTPQPKAAVPAWSLLPPGPDAVALAVTDQGFADSLKRQIVYDVVRDRVFQRRFERLAQIYRDGNVTSPDPDVTFEQMVANAVAGSLETTEGRLELGASTPGPVGSGELVERVHPPDPFGPFDLHIYHFDLHLAEGRITGEVRGRGRVIGIGLEATQRFSVRPTVDDHGNLILADPVIPDPELDVDLGVFDWALGALVTAVSNFAFGVLTVLGVDSLAEAVAAPFLADRIRSRVHDNLGSASTGGVPTGMRLSGVTVTPALLQLTGSWFVRVSGASVDQSLSIDTTSVRELLPFGGRPRHTHLACMGSLGLVQANENGIGQEFEYHVRHATSTVTATLRSTYLPLPLREISWAVYASPQNPRHHQPGLGGTGRVPLVAGTVTLSGKVWVPEPPMWGDEVDAEFDVVASGDHAGWRLEVPSEASAIRLGVTVEAVDDTGVRWTAVAHEVVSNRWIDWGASEPQVEALTKECAKQRTVPSGQQQVGELDPIWNPPWERDPIDLGDASQRLQPQVAAQLVDRLGVARAVQAVAARRGIGR